MVFFGGGGERWMVVAGDHSGGNGADASGGDDIGPNDGTASLFSSQLTYYF